MSVADYTPNGSRAKLRVAMLAPPWIPVPPPAYGGIESVVALLCEGHVRRGHDVTLFAPPGSTSSANVISPLEEPHPQRINFTLDEADHVAFALEQIQCAEDEGAPYDVIHDHCGYVTVAFADRVEVPVVHTVHGPFNEDNLAFYERHGPKVGIACLSRFQLDHAPVACELARVVPNPIDANRWPFQAEKDDYLLWIGRMHPDKGPSRAIDAAREAGLPLVLAGPVQPGQEAYFSEQVEPKIDGEAVRYVGEVDCEEKRCLFARARALLMPIRWPEPFGMVMVEALACGTPVIAFPEGAAPEIVIHGETGLLVGDESEMAAAARAVEIAPEACRRSVLERYDTDRVAELYENFYREAIESREREHAGSVARI